MKAFQKRYLGDGAYVECSNYRMIFTTENGICTTNSISIDVGDMPELKRALQDAGVLPVEGESDIEMARRLGNVEYLDDTPDDERADDTPKRERTQAEDWR